MPGEPVACWVMPWRRMDDPGGHLRGLSDAVRGDLYRHLTASPDRRAEAIGGLYSRTQTSELAEVLIDIEADPILRLEVLRALRDSLADADRR